MPTWLFIIILAFLIALVVFVVKSLNSKKKHSLPENYRISENRECPTDNHYPKTLKASHLLPKLIEVKEKSQFNWKVLHDSINSNGDSIIESKLTKLIREEREHIIVDKFIYYARENPDADITAILKKIEQNVTDYQTILRRL